MITVSYKLTDTMYLKVSGHAPKGMEFLCSAISVLTDTLAHLVGKNDESVDNIVLEDGYGEIYSKNLQNKPLFEFALAGISQIANVYPRWVQFQEEQSLS